MKNRKSGFWHALEAVPGAAAVDIEWKALLGSDYETAKAFLRPNGKMAASHPCMVRRGCGCEHEVVVHDSEDIVAVCRCERGCETFSLQRSDIVVYELDRRSLDAALAKVFGLFEETDSATDLPGTTRIGVYSLYAGYRFPVYLTIQMEPDDFNRILDGLLSRNDNPFILLAPTRNHCTSMAEKRLAAKGSIYIPLSENVSRQFQLLRSMDDIFANLPRPKENDARLFFPTPPDAIWENVSIRFKDGHTVSIKVKSVGGVFNYTQMGMANKKNGNPTLQWKLLEVFANERGILDWSSDEANPRNQKRRELLAANLREFFRIKGDPFKMTKDGKGWQARFLISPEE
ncbi:hypothetical protein [Syntrophorhabdus aromaticivorans]|jgi:hypothetical protein|uniref:hypothetical protein n=1 Tax=Syntrophorhabdus aromaticivorans TaxID=328301 RepID=UPI0004171B66|nr:hypothetical protein [Syntrophorhabdus aromaticivorans]MCA9464213.1 hypothetical protein [Nitrospira sp.]